MELLIVLLSMPFEFYLSVGGMFCGIYLLLINPILFKFWIMPKIEDRYGKLLRIKTEDYYMKYTPLASWTLPQLDISGYIFCKYLKCELPGVKKPWKKSLSFKLKEINYDIKTASKAEIVMSFITIFLLGYLVCVGIIITVEDKILGTWGGHYKSEVAMKK
jgi:hypothetical protein